MTLTIHFYKLANLKVVRTLFCNSRICNYRNYRDNRNYGKYDRRRNFSRGRILETDIMEEMEVAEINHLGEMSYIINNTLE